MYLDAIFAMEVNSVTIASCQQRWRTDCWAKYCGMSCDCDVGSYQWLHLRRLVVTLW